MSRKFAEGTVVSVPKSTAERPVAVPDRGRVLKALASPLHGRRGRKRADADWIPVSTSLPDEGVVVLTKIDDEKGARNEQPLRILGRLWYVADGAMYAYYCPTHWRALS